MFRWAIIIWLLGLFTIVPYQIYYLFFEATREQYAFYIVFPLFWIFGFWGVVGPILSAIKLRQFFKALEMVESEDDLKRLINEPDSREAAIELIASENHIPKFIARRLYENCAKRLSASHSKEEH